MELEKKVAQEHTNEKSLAEDVKEQQKNVESLDAEVRRCRDLRHNIHTVIDPLKVRVFFVFLKRKLSRTRCLV